MIRVRRRKSNLVGTTTTAFFPIVRKAVVIVIAAVAAGMLCGSRIQAAELPFLGVVTSQTLNVRSGQSTNFEKVGTLAEGEQVIVVDQSYGWYKVKLPANADSYLSADFVKILGDGIGEATGSRVNIRSRPMVGSTVLGQVERGTLVRILGEPQPGWLQIEPIDESYGWVSEEFVRFASADLPAPRAVQLPVKNIYVKERQAAEKAVQQAAAEQAGAGGPSRGRAAEEFAAGPGDRHLLGRSAGRDGCPSPIAGGWPAKIFPARISTHL